MAQRKVKKFTVGPLPTQPPRVLPEPVLRDPGPVVNAMLRNLALKIRVHRNVHATMKVEGIDDQGAVADIIANLRDSHYRLWLTAQGINPERKVISLTDTECALVKRYWELRGDEA